jgi:hypothetical protein
MNEIQEVWVLTYCDLSALYFTVLEMAANGTLKGIGNDMGRALADLISGENQLTEHGRQVLARANQIIQDGPEPALLSDAQFLQLDGKSKISLANKARKISGQYYNSEDIEVMRTLAACPGLGIKHLRRVYGNLDSMMERGIITQAEWRGDPVYLTESSRQLLIHLAGE